MICAINCTCMLCRELQSCKPKNAKCNGKSSDNFILRKAEGFKSSNALGFIRGAARLSVRHWQNKEASVPQAGAQSPRVNKSTSCEQLFPPKSAEKMFRAPSCEQLRNDQKPLFRMFSDSAKVASKFRGADALAREAPLKAPGRFRKKDDPIKNTYEKYVPLAPPYEPKHNGHSKYVNGDNKCKPPIYQEVRKKLEKDKNWQPSAVKISESNKKQTTDLAACFQELSQKNIGDSRKSHNVTISEGPRRAEPPHHPSPDKINHKVVIYFGDSIARNRQSPEKPSAPPPPPFPKTEDIYAKRLLEETGNLGINKEQKTSGTAELISQISVENEPVYSEISFSEQNKAESTEPSEGHETPAERKNIIYQDSTNNVVAVCAADGVINVEFRDNFECARKLVDIISGKIEEANEATFLETDSCDSLDWSFVQNWRKRPPNGSRGDVAYNGSSPSNIQNSINFKHATPTSKPAHTTSLHLLAQSPQNGDSSPVSSATTRVHTPANIVQHPKLSKEFCLSSKAISIDKHDDIVPHSHGRRQDDGVRQTHSHHAMMARNSQAVAQSPSYALDLKSGHLSQQNSMIPERDTGPSKVSASPMKTATQSGTPIKSVTSPSKTTVQSTPVKCQNPMISYGLDRSNAKKESTPAKEWRIIPGSDSTPELEKISSKTRQHHHLNIGHDIKNGLSRTTRECNSSSDENRSSGHASMSDSGGGGCGRGGDGDGATPSPSAAPTVDKLSAAVTQRSARSHHSRTRHRATPAKVLQSPWPGGGGLDEIRTAIRQLTLRSRASTTSTATSTCTTTSCSEGGGGAGGATGAGAAGAGSPSRRRRQPLARHPSLDTVCTNVTSADEFVWVDSHNRLVELQQLPWSASDLQRALHQGRCKDHMVRVSTETVPRLGYLLQRALVRVAREAHRLSQSFGICSKHEIAGALRIVLCPSLADSCVKACLRAGTMFAVSGDTGLRQSKSQRAALQLSVGRFQRWMVDVRLGRFIHEYAAIYLCAGMETLLEEILLQCLPSEASTYLTPSILEHAIAASGDLWGLLQPYAHLNAGRVASGALSMPRWASLSSIGSGGSTNSNTNSGNEPSGSGNNSTHQVSSPSGNQSLGNVSNGSGAVSRASTSAGSVGSMTDSCLLTTCVGTVAELRELLTRVPHSPPLTTAAINALFYFMRCSQLEHTSAGAGAAGAGAGGGGAGGVQELWYERAYGVLPPLVEWTRVAAAHADQRAAAAADADDVLQAARLLLPGVDCPPRPISAEESPSGRRGAGAEEGAWASLALAQRLLAAGRPELVATARALLPAAGLDAADHRGLTALMRAAAAADEQATAMLLEAGADPNVETPGCGGAAAPGARGPAAAGAAATWWGGTAGWTALVYAAAAGGSGARAVAALLLRAGARVEGAAGGADDKCTLTPLQVACGSGNAEVVQLLVAHGAHPFLSTLLKEPLCYAGPAQRGCCSAVAVCCAHGRRGCLRALLARPARPPATRDVLSLEEMLAEGSPERPDDSPDADADARAPKFTKSQLRALQEAMYHAAETNHLDITLELRALGVGWSLHAWMLSLAAAADARADCVIDQLLQDFLQVCPPDDSHYGRAFVHDCLPLLFNIFRYSKKEGTILLLADIFCTCYGWEAIKPIREPAPAQNNGSRIDPKFVNNPELSDVTFRVEGRLFYGHKIVLVTSSPRLRAMLAPSRSGSGPTLANPVGGTTSASGSNPNLLNSSQSQSPIVQINDIRYHIFQQVMQFLYCGGCAGLEVPPGEVVELLAAASFFQLLPLQRFCESRAALALDMHNVVTMYIHAKVYGAAQLLEYCQGFLLQNMVALLTYDDSVKRLLFGKRLPGHDVLGALLTALQNRIKSRKTNSNKNR